jgi:hypothetical protein
MTKRRLTPIQSAIEIAKDLHAVGAIDDTTMRNFEKNPGPDWVVEYRWLGESDEGVSEYVTIFGAATVEIALTEARSSLDLGKEPYAIIGVDLTDEEFFDRLTAQAMADIEEEEGPYDWGPEGPPLPDKDDDK